MISAPENATRPDVGIQAPVSTAGGPGEQIALMQMYEDKYYGETSSNPIADPNPRLEAAIDKPQQRITRASACCLTAISMTQTSCAATRRRWTMSAPLLLAKGWISTLASAILRPGGIHAKLVLVPLAIDVDGVR